MGEYGKGEGALRSGGRKGRGGDGRWKALKTVRQWRGRVAGGDGWLGDLLREQLSLFSRIRICEQMPLDRLIRHLPTPWGACTLVA